MNKPLLTIIAASLFSLAVTGCGGEDSNDGVVVVEPPLPPAQTGVFTDSPVAGVKYTTSTGYTGTTNANGEFRFNPGETVTFEIGGIQLGSVPAAATITPLELAGTDTNKATNLLVLLQSLDADGNPDNGITINASTATAAESVTTLNLSVPPSEFSNVSNTTLTGLLTAADLPPSNLVTPEEAAAHFKTQFFSQLKGVWKLDQLNGAVTIQVGALSQQTGKAPYILAEAGVAQGEGKSGTEAGMLDWDPASGVLSVSNISHDSNGDWGLSHDEGMKVRFDGAKLVLDFGGEDKVSLTRVDNNQASLVGAWELEGYPFAINFTFFANGTYLMADTVGDNDVDPTEGPCGQPGSEFGNYAVNGAQISVSISEANAANYNSNGCAGLWESAAYSSDPIGFALSNEGNTLTVTFQDDDQPVVLRRVSN